MKKFIGMVVVGIVLLTFSYWFFLSAPSGDASVRLFKIEAGEKMEEIATKLKQENLIRSKKIFLLFSQFKGLDTKLKPGRYKLRKNMNVQEVLFAVSNPEQGETPVTIPEGFTVFEIDKRLTDMGLILPGEFSSGALQYEGFLFPDTYSVYKFNFDPDDLIKKMQQNFLAKLTPDLLQAIETSGRSLQSAITMASILEKEVKTTADYPVVAGILWKRMDSDWPLQVDSTILYGRNSRTITSEELTEDSPYNTRNRKGLPPTPIGNPGIATIRAAIFPKESDYWFYLTDEEGNVHYAKTNEEHNENKRRYL